MDNGQKGPVLMSIRSISILFYLIKMIKLMAVDQLNPGGPLLQQLPNLDFLFQITHLSF